MAFKQLADRFYRFSTVKQTRVKRRPIVNENNAAAILAFSVLNICHIAINFQYKCIIFLLHNAKS